MDNASQLPLTKLLITLSLMEYAAVFMHAVYRSHRICAQFTHCHLLRRERERLRGNTIEKSSFYWRCCCCYGLVRTVEPKRLIDNFRETKP